MLSLISRDVLDPMLRGTEVGKKTREKKEVLRYRNGTEGKRERFVPCVMDTRQKKRNQRVWTIGNTQNCSSLFRKYIRRS